MRKKVLHRPDQQATGLGFGCMVYCTLYCAYIEEPSCAPSNPNLIKPQLIPFLFISQRTTEDGENKIFE